ncbi:hypothetical protein [Planctomycetes bacterium K23_9]|uniref:Uncharacterized protein n=1 Tax=Stieleria marina TaxID=1930275 RepID=A0A517NNC5_9BACT|nr:hypothetical protein K239x_05750 [Planctomycetes bacterium K23_9]
MNDPDRKPVATAPTINPYAPTHEVLDPMVSTEPVEMEIVGSGEVIGNGILGVGVSGAVVGFFLAVASVLWNFGSLSPGMLTTPIIAVVFGFTLGCAVAMATVPLVYLVFVAMGHTTADWTPDSLTRFAAVSGFTSWLAASLLPALMANAFFLILGGCVGLAGALVSVRVFRPLKLMVAKRLVAEQSAADTTHQQA